MTSCTAAARRRHRRLADYCESHLPHTVGHVDVLTEPTLQTELVLPTTTTVPPAVLTAISLSGLGIATVTPQGAALVAVCR